MFWRALQKKEARRRPPHSGARTPSASARDLSNLRKGIKLCIIVGTIGALFDTLFHAPGCRLARAHPKITAAMFATTSVTAPVARPAPAAPRASSDSARSRSTSIVGIVHACGNALGGGAGLGWAHIGVLHALKEQDIEIEIDKILIKILSILSV